MERLHPGRSNVGSSKIGRHGNETLAKRAGRVRNEIIPPIWSNVQSRRLAFDVFVRLERRLAGLAVVDESLGVVRAEIDIR